MKFKLLFGFSLLGSLLACGQVSFDEKVQSMYRNTVPLISSEELIELQKSSEIYLLDTRAPKEYRVSHLPDALLVDYDRFSKRDVQEMEIPKDAPVVVYCSVGYRSERVGEKLKKMGYSNVQNLYGGIFDWKNKGNTVVNEVSQPTDSVHTYNEDWSQWLYNGIKVYE